jgi:hypothetical protein
MRNFIVCVLLVIVPGCDRRATKADVDQPAATENWISLFNGKDLSGWNVKIRGHELNDNFANTFRVEDGVMKVSYDGYTKFEDTFGHIFYGEPYSSYVLDLEYRFVGEQVPGGPDWAFRNSGVMLHCQDPKTLGKDQDFPISIEVQLLGGNGKDERTTANLCTPGTNVVMDGKLVTDHCISSKSETYHGDQWVNVRVLVLSDSVIRHIIGGHVVLEYFKPQVGGGNVSGHDPTVKKDGTLLQQGYISLQSESHPAEFRKVKLLDLSPYAGDKSRLDSILRQLNLH